MGRRGRGGGGAGEDGGSIERWREGEKERRRKRAKLIDRNCYTALKHDPNPKYVLGGAGYPVSGKLGVRVLEI